jgi:hypothetical protein
VNTFQPQVEDHQVVVHHKQFLSMIGRSCVVAPPIQTLTDRLREARFLVEDQPDRWVIGRAAWDFTTSLVKTR